MKQHILKKASVEKIENGDTYIQRIDTIVKKYEDNHETLEKITDKIETFLLQENINDQARSILEYMLIRVKISLPEPVDYSANNHKISSDVRSIAVAIEELKFNKEIPLKNIQADIIETYKNESIWEIIVSEVNYETLKLDTNKIQSPWERGYAIAYNTNGDRETYAVIGYKKLENGSWQAEIKWDYFPVDNSEPNGLFKNPNSWEYISHRDILEVK